MQTDGHDEANSHFSQFCECAKKRTAASIKRWNSIKCLHSRETYIQKTWYYLIGVVLSNALFDNEIFLFFVFQDFESKWQSFETLISGNERKAQHIDTIVRSKTQLEEAKQTIQVTDANG